MNSKLKIAVKHNNTHALISDFYDLMSRQGSNSSFIKTKTRLILCNTYIIFLTVVFYGKLRIIEGRNLNGQLICGCNFAFAGEDDYDFFLYVLQLSQEE